MLDRWYNINGFFTICLKGDSAFFRAIDFYLGHFKFSPSNNDDVADITFICKPPLLRMSYEVGENYYFDGETFFSKNLMYGLKIMQGRRYVIYCPVNSKFINFETIIWMKLLEKGLTFVHAAGLRYGDDCILFPAWGGVGKTSLTIFLLKHKSDWKLLGDDLVIMSRKGIVYHYPSPFAIYPYHISLFSEFLDAREKMFLRLSKFLNPITSQSTLSRRLLRRLGLYKEHIRIPVKQIFPREKLIESAPLSKIYLLTRSSMKKFHIKECSKKDISRNIIGVLCYENSSIPPSLQDVAAMSAFGLFDISKLMKTLNIIVDDAVSRAKCYKVFLPLKCNLHKIAKEIESHVRTS